MQGDILAAAEFLEYFGMTNQGSNKGFTVEVMVEVSINTPTL